jgi:hypothetical protein
VFWFHILWKLWSNHLLLWLFSLSSLKWQNFWNIFIDVLYYFIYNGLIGLRIPVNLNFHCNHSGCCSCSEVTKCCLRWSEAGTGSPRLGPIIQLQSNCKDLMNRLTCYSSVGAKEMPWGYWTLVWAVSDSFANCESHKLSISFLATGEHQPEQGYPAKRPKIIYSPSYADFRSRANTTRRLDFDHMMRWEHTKEVWG